MKDVLSFLNELDFTNKLDNHCFEKIDEKKRMVFGEIEDYKISKMIYALNIVDEIKLSTRTNDLDYRLERTDPLRSVIHYLISFKIFDDTHEEHERDADNRHVIEH